MNRIDLGNGLAAAFVIAVALGAALLVGAPAVPDPVIARAGVPAPDASVELVELVDLADGRRAVIDAAGHPVPIAAYRRIVSGNTVTDWLVSELCEHERILAVTELSATQAPWRQRFSGLQTITTLASIEDVVARAPDLVLASGLGDPRHLARLRQAGMEVFDIGQTRGVASVLITLRRLGALFDRTERAEILARRWQRSLTAIAHDIPAGARPRGLYVSAYGSKLYGGTVGSAYHDILGFAGIDDAAATRYRDFPEYAAEDILALDPELLVTRAGQTSVLCTAPGLDRLAACRVPGAIIEIDPFLLDDPGMGILEAAEALHQAVLPSFDLSRAPDR